MAESARWRVSARVAVLDAGLSAIAAGRGVSRLTVDADEVRVEGALILPGCAVEIRCRVLRSRDGVLDVSAPATPPPEAPVAADGTAAAPDGRDGAPGAPGGKGGDVRIHCDRIEGRLRVIAHGGAGGASQGGGRGVKPATRHGRDGAFRQVPKRFGPWGGKVVKDGDGSAGFANLYWPATRLVTVSYGEPGPAGAKGGDGGAPGQPGRGGDGGDIAIECLTLAASPELASAGGAPGTCGKSGQGGDGGDGGQGGLHRLYYKHGKYEYNVLMNSTIKEAGWARDDWRVPVRASASAVKGPAGRDSDSVLEAAPGHAGRVRIQRVDLAALARSFDLGYLGHVRTWASEAPSQRAAMIRWGVALLDHLPEAGDPAGAALREALEGLLPAPPAIDGGVLGVTAPGEPADEVSLELEDSVAIITLDRPRDQNRLTRDVLATLQGLVERLAVDEHVQVVVITGSGTEFFSMGILDPAVRASYTKEQVLELVRMANRLYDAIEALPQIVIAALNGAARAGAAELSLACDIRLAAGHATFALPEARWGGFPGAGGPVRLPAIVGRARALELIGTGREVSAVEMERIGLVLAVHPAGRLLAEARALAASIARSGPLATRGAKRIARVRGAEGFAAARALSDALRHALEWSRDIDEGMAAHREGRPPRFTGR